MSDIYSSSVPGFPRGNPADWVETERTRKNKKKRNRADAPYDPSAPPVPSPGLGSVPAQPPSPIDVSPGLGGGSGIDPNQGGTTKLSTDPAVYGRQTNENSIRAFPNSFAAGIPGMGADANPFSLPAFAQSPVLIANKMLGDKYGLPAGSNVANALASYFNPHDKAIGMGGKYPDTNVDWINMGAALMSGLNENGAQLDPKSMMAHAVQAIIAEAQQTMKGGAGTAGGDYPGPLAALAHDDPSTALDKFGSLVKGMLAGTMPVDEIDSYVEWLMRAGQTFLQQFYQSPHAAQDEAAGINFISALVQKLGPSLGL